ncbi:MAG: hypothetical protein EPN26_12040 [Rhodospirillales bacterium]|nr:MAG: hypothetical protein EPN26_12040 [Rhodospirillales bacterium]
MTTWSLPQLFGNLHHQIVSDLETARQSIGHPGLMGDASEAVWNELFNKYLPKRYTSSKAIIVDSEGEFSQQIDVAIHDRQYSPFVWSFNGVDVLPAESVYAVFEAKQSINASMVEYAASKIASVRKLRRNSQPIPTAGGELPAREPFAILGGLLSFESDWSPPLGQSLQKALNNFHGPEFIDICCVAAHGYITVHTQGGSTVFDGPKATTAFLLELIACLQSLGTVPMLDVRAYARWLTQGQEN